MDKTIKLSELEEDLIKELFNLGVGRAAASLSRMVRQEVLLSIPDIEFQSSKGLLEMLGTDHEIVSISQDISGPFSARSMLLFHEDSSMQVVKAMLGHQMSDEMIAELQEEALTEIGNIVLNACIGSISQTMDESFSVEIPNFYKANPEIILEHNNLENNDIIMLLKIDMTLKESDANGYLAFIFGPGAIEDLYKSLNNMLAGLGAP